jgi:hypothetical protein
MVRGATAIAGELNRSVRWVYAHSADLPVFYDAGMLCAFKSALEAQAQARVKRLDELRVQMTKNAAKAAPIIEKRRGRRSREAAAKMLRRQRRRQREAAAVASTA